jgi:predicted CXXCH cytochrome family protein
VKPWMFAIAFVVVAVVAIGGLADAFLLPGLSVARQEASPVEVSVATWLLRHSVPAADKKRVNSLGAHPDAAAVRAGKDLFAAKCESCHAYDGGGKTEMGAGQFPRPPSLHAVVPALTDGEVFYHIRNGVRNTAMPAWNMPDGQLWQVVSFLRDMPKVASEQPEAMAAKQSAAVLGAHYVGSATCQTCHQEVYARWAQTRMANVVRDPAVHPDAIIPDMSKPDPLVKFTAKDIALVYGSHWKQRYFKKVGNDYVPFPVQWDIANKKWLPYHVKDGTDWWAAHYPDPKGDNSARPTGPLCDGCHSVDYNIKTQTQKEWNVGCEQCHGAGSAHAANPSAVNIFNPSRQASAVASDTCIQCHSQGQPLKNPIEGKYYDWPVGYHAGLKLADYWKLEEHTLGETTFTHFADGTAHKNRMQGNDFVQSLMYARGVTCFSCHDPHGTKNEAMLRKPVNEVCLTCHGPNTQNGPHAMTLAEHTHHKPGSPGSECVSCHMPKIEQTVGKVNVSSHTFRFVTPEQSEKLKVPNACTTCHADKSSAWATAALKGWSDRSPWRMSQ